MKLKNGACVLALALLAAVAPLARADTMVTVTASGVTDGNLPINATAVFDINYTAGTVTVTLTNNLPYNQDFTVAQDLSFLSFQLANGATLLNTLTGGSTITDPSAQVVNDSGISSTTLVTPTSASVSWYAENLGSNGTFGGNASAQGGGGKVTLGTDAFIIATSTSPIDGTNSIIGTDNAGYYTQTTPPTGTCTEGGKNPCGSGAPIDSDTSYGTQFGGQMVYNTATFTFDVSGLTSSTALSNVYFGFGPDGPDLDDWVTAGGSVLGGTPEPTSLVLCGIGLALLAGWRVRQLHLFTR